MLLMYSFLICLQVKATDYSVIINELGWAGSTYSGLDEFIELKNLSTDEIDLNGWYLTRLVNDEENVMIEFVENSFIAADGFFVISNYDMENSVLNFEPDLVDSAISLSNSELQIKLYNADGELVDVAGNGNEPFAGDNDLKASMARKIEIQDGDLPDSWSASLRSENLDELVEDLATPGAENFEIEEPINEENFASDDEVIAEDDFASNDETIIEDNFASDDEVIIEDDFASDDVEPVLEETDEQVEPEEKTEENEQKLGKLIINEVAFKESQDWVELKVLEAGNFKDWKIYQGTSLIDEINEDKDFQKDELILLNLEKNLTGTDNILVLKDLADQISDVVIWSNNNGSFTKSKLQAQQLVEDRHWLTNDNFNENDQGAWTTSDDINESMSLIRLTDLDTNSALDWNYTYEMTPGQENILKLSEEIFESQIIEEPEIEDNPPIIELENDLETTEPIDLTGKLIINEILSHPFSGQTEWIEIYNLFDQDIDITDFYLQEGSGTKFYLKGIIPAEFYMIIKTKNLNNAGDMVELYSNDNKLLDQVIYGKLENSMVYFDAKKALLPYSFIKDASGFWKFTSLPTPGTENVFQKVVFEEKKLKTEELKNLRTEEQKKKKKEKEKEYVKLTSDNLEQVKDNDLVSFEGVVTVFPGLFYKQKMYMQNEQLAIEVYFHKADWPNLQIGQTVKVQGKFARKDMNQIKISSAENMEIINSAEQEIISKEYDFNNEKPLIGFIVSTQGEISEKLASGFNLVMSEGDLPVCFKKNAGLDTSKYQNEQKVLVSGILLSNKNNVCLYPRIEEDISISQEEVVSGVAEIASLPAKKQFPVKIILLIAAGVLSGGIGFLYLLKKGKLPLRRLLRGAG